MAYVSMKQMLETGVHFGHQTRRWNPKMRPFIFGARNGIHIIDLQQTVKLYRTAHDKVVETVANGGRVLFIGTKRQAQEAVAAENEANKVFYAIGTNKELKKNGLLEKNFLGATKVMKGNYNAAYFTTADKRNITTIPTTAKKVKVWSNMPADSYQIVSNADGIKSIKITNPAKFWSLTPYLIIQVD